MEQKQNTNGKLDDVLSPLTGRSWRNPGLSLATQLMELLEEINIYTKAVASGSFMGSLRNVSGTSGIIIGEKLTEAFDKISVETDKRWNPIAADAIMSTIEKEQDEVAKSGRAVSIVDMKDFQMARKPTGIAQGAAASVPSEMSMTKRTLSGILDAGEVAAKVMRFRT